jgi:hypothetical protein
MLKTFLSLALVAGLFGVTPSLADTNNGGSGSIGRGCTLNPFNHTMRCIDFDHCTTDKQGRKTCPTTTTTTRASVADGKTAGNKTAGGKKGDKASDYLVVTMEQVLVSG